MKKLSLLVIALMLFSYPVNAAQWDKDSPDIETLYVDECFTAGLNNQDALDRLLTDYKSGCNIFYSSTVAFDVSAGELTLSNSAGTIRLFCKNTSTVSTTPSVSASTTYYVYAVASAITQETFTIEVSTNATTPTETYFKKLGSFVTDGSSLITTIQNNNKDGKVFGDWIAKSSGTVYLAATDGYVTTTRTASSSNTAGYSDASNPPTTIRTSNSHYGYTAPAGICMPVKKGHYYKVVGTVDSMYWIPSA